MSISRFRDSLERPGCKWIASALSLGMAAGFLFGGNQCMQLFGGGNNQQQKEELGQVLAQIGDYKVYEKPVQNRVEHPQQGQAIDPLTAKPDDYSKAYGFALDAEVTACLLLEEAKDNGYPTDDKAILDAVGVEYDRRVEMEKMQAGFQNKIPQNASDKDYDAYIKKTTGKSLAEQKQAYLDSFQKALNDPTVRDGLLKVYANDIVVNGIDKTVTVTDDDLKHSKDEYVGKHILFLPSKHPGADLEKEASQVLADLNSKKITFEDAMDKYSDEAAAKGKKVHDNTTTTDTMTWKFTPDFANLRDLKQGQISEVIPNKPEGYAIFELVSVINPPMPDFAKTKDDLKKSYLQTVSAAKLQDGLKKLRGGNTIKWEVEGWGLLEDWDQATTGSDSNFASKSPAEQNKINQGFLDKASKVSDSGGMLTAIGALMPLWNSAKGPAKDALDAEYLKLMPDFLNQYPSFSGRMDLSALAAVKKNSTLLDSSLLAACDINDAAVAQGSTGEANFADIAAALDKYHSGGQLTSDQAKAIQTKLDMWRDEKLQEDIDQAKEAKEEAAERAKVDEERKKAEASKPKPPAPAPIVGKGVRALPPSAPKTPATGATLPGTAAPASPAPKVTLTPTAPAKTAPTPTPAKPSGK